MINLLSNALKFSKTNDTVVVKLDLRENPDSRDVELIISVSDTGIGIADSDIEKIFAPGFKTEDKISLSKNGYGNGLGLSICKRIVQHLNGSIYVWSKLGLGSTFSVLLRTKKSDD